MHESTSAFCVAIMSETVLRARIAEKEAEMNQVDQKLQALNEKIDTSNRRLPRRPGINGDQV